MQLLITGLLLIFVIGLVFLSFPLAVALSVVFGSLGIVVVFFSIWFIFKNK